MNDISALVGGQRRINDRSDHCHLFSKWKDGWNRAKPAMQNSHAC